MITKNIAVILDLAFAGYGAVRSLTAHNVEVIGFYNDKFLPESYTRLCKEKIYFNNDKQLLDKLLKLSNDYDKKPVLILSTDYYVQFYSKNRNVLTQKFLIDMPSNDIIELLLDKNKFSFFAKKNNILIPPSIEINNKNDIQEVKKLRFPIILKPYLRTSKWDNAGLPKVYNFENFEAFLKIYDEVSKIEPYLIAQEFIQGNDDNVKYCLTYYSSKSKCLSTFTGKKIRQWPVFVGSTATTTICENDFVKNETIRIFNLLNFKGFGSIEYKKNLRDGKYYLIEPTVGRLNQQEYVATLCGYNIPSIAFNKLVGNNYNNISKQQKIIYIDIPSEIKSIFYCFKHNLITFSSWKKSLKGSKAFRFWNRKDPLVFFGLIVKLTMKSVKIFKTKK